MKHDTPAKEKVGSAVPEWQFANPKVVERSSHEPQKANISRHVQADSFDGAKRGRTAQQYRLPQSRSPSRFHDHTAASRTTSKDVDQSDDVGVVGPNNERGRYVEVKARRRKLLHVVSLERACMRSMRKRGLVQQFPEERDDETVTVNLAAGMSWGTAAIRSTSTESDRASQGGLSTFGGTDGSSLMSTGPIGRAVHFARPKHPAVL